MVVNFGTSSAEPTSSASTFLVTQRFYNSVAEDKAY
jgi:hypothetical protein